MSMIQLYVESIRHWHMLPRFRHHNPDEFWKRDKVSYPPTYLELMVDDSDW